MAIERTFSMIKPDATRRNLTGAIVRMLEEGGLRVVASKRVWMSRRDAEGAFLGFSRDEVRAAVEEAENAQTYVAAHLYTDEAIRRAVECGVVSVEHGNLVSRDTAALIKEKGAFVVPTNVTFDRLAIDGAALGLPPESVAKIEDVREAGLEALTILHEAGVLMGYGSDLLGDMHRHQSDEFVLRARHLPAMDVIRSATLDAARALRMEGAVGTIAAGAFADLVVVDGDPLQDLTLLTGQGQHMPLIIKGGAILKGSGRF